MTPSASSESVDLETAFRDTDYFVDGPDGRFAVRVDEICEKLDELLPCVPQLRWAYITACNPNSDRKSETKNPDRMHQLESDVRAAGYQYYRGEGVGRVGDWPAEPSLLIIGIEKPAALFLARCYGQDAFIFGTRGQPARLVWTKV